MAEYKVVNITQLENDLTTFANSIRAKANISTPLTFPDGFAQGISNIALSENFEFLLDEKVTLADVIYTSSTAVVFQPDALTDLPEEYEIGMIGSSEKVITRCVGASCISIYYRSYNKVWQSNQGSMMLSINENGEVVLRTGANFAMNSGEYYLYIMGKKEA